MSNASGKNISCSNYFLIYFHTIAWAIGDMDVQSPRASRTGQLWRPDMNRPDEHLFCVSKALILVKILRFNSMWTLRPGRAPNVDWSCLLADQNSHWLQEELTRHAELSPSAMKARKTVVGKEMSQRVAAAVWLLLSQLRAFAFDLQIVIIPRLCWKCIYFVLILKLLQRL